MGRLGALIIDDEPLARDTIRLLLEADPDIDVLAECADGAEAIEAVRSLEPDIVFLDIQMPIKNGFEVIEAVGSDQMPVTVFATAYDEYAIQAFDSAALDYLLKPFDDERFEKAVRRAKEAVSRRKTGLFEDQLGGLLRRIADDVQSESTTVGRLMVKDRDTVRFIKTEDIEWIEAAGDYVSLNASGRSHLIRETMAAMETKLGASGFVRIHRSTIVNLEHVRELKAYFHGDYIVYMSSGKELRLSRRYWDRVQAAIGSSGK
ncbi:MAG: response regulator transcription factor [Rhodothermales bacterium]|nr:response regulator transcription factor [Rhodothermales bacterium]